MKAQQARQIRKRRVPSPARANDNLNLSLSFVVRFRSFLLHFPRLFRIVRFSVLSLKWVATGTLYAEITRLRALRRQIREIERSGLFDRRWYLRAYPVVARSEIGPIEDFLRFGAAHLRDPGPNFSTRHYVWRYGDRLAGEVNPLLHYIRVGKAAGYAIVPAATDRHRVGRASTDDIYDDWIRCYDTLDADDLARIGARIAAMPQPPAVALVLLVTGIDDEMLAAAIRSVTGQIYPYWTLSIRYRAPLPASTRALIDDFVRQDWRISCAVMPADGRIGELGENASGAAGEQAAYLGFIDDGGRLPAHALYALIEEIAGHPEADIVFGDEDSIDIDGLRHEPQFKSDWNPDLMLSQNAVGDLVLFRRALLERAGCVVGDLADRSRHALILRAGEATSAARIRHVPRILYHRLRPQAREAAPGRDNAAAWFEGKRAIEQHLARRAISATVLPAADHTAYRVSYALDTEPSVSIVIPTRDRLALLQGCVTSLLDTTTYQNREIIIVDNGSVEPETLGYLEELRARQLVTLIRDASPFNYSRLNNRAAAVASGTYLCLLNNDTVAITPDWLHEMVSHAIQPGVGAVGGMLYYGNDTIQHAGVVTGIGGTAAHIYRTLPRGSLGYFGRAAVTQTLGAVTGACLLTPRALYRELGGLNETALSVAYNDVDYCLRLREAGYRVVWTPHAELYHLESISRGSDLLSLKRIRRAQTEIAYLVERWGDALHIDPYFNPNLDLLSTTPKLAMQPRVRPIAR